MATPTLVQRTFGSSSTNATAGTAVIKYRFPNPTQSGNCLILPVQSDTSVSGAPVITDNIGTGTWTSRANRTAGQRADIFVQPNCPAGISEITVTYQGSANPAYKQAGAYEWANIDQSANPTDGTNGALSASPVAPGAFTTTADGDLIFLFILEDTSGPPTAVTKFAGSAGVKMLSANNVDGNACAYVIQTTHGSINPSVTVTGGTDNFQCLALALKSASAGTVPAAGRIIGVQHVAIDVTQSRPYALQVPVYGNFQVVTSICIGAAATGITSISDTNGNTYTGTGGSNDADGSVDIWSALNSTPNDQNVLTIQIDSDINAGSTFVIYDIDTGATPWAFDTRGSASGTQSTTADLVTASVTPSRTGGISVGVVSIISHTVSGLASPSDGTFDSYVDPGFNGVGTTLDQDNGWAHRYNTDLNANTFTWTIQHNTAPAGVGGWGALAAAFSPVASGAKAPAPAYKRIIGWTA
jgi:hypothetical protein